MTLNAYLVEVETRSIRMVTIDPANSLADIRRHIGCNLIDMVRIDRNHCIIVDDNGLMDEIPMLHRGGGLCKSAGRQSPDRRYRPVWRNRFTAAAHRGFCRHPDDPVPGPVTDFRGNQRTACIRQPRQRFYRHAEGRQSGRHRHGVRATEGGGNPVPAHPIRRAKDPTDGSVIAPSPGGPDRPARPAARGPSPLTLSLNTDTAPLAPWALLLSGSSGALLPRCPLRTGRTDRPVPGSSHSSAPCRGTRSLDG